MLQSTLMQLLWNGFITVDIFFFISGFVNSYSRVLTRKAGKSEDGFFARIFHRLWRIYPAFIVGFIFFHLAVQPQPPFDYRTQHEIIQNCENNWWLNFLFINNFFSFHDTCMQQSWFISVDMQLFLVTLFTLPLILRKPKMGIILHIVIIIVGNLYVMSWYLLDDIYPIPVEYTSLDKNSSVTEAKVYMHPVTHVGSYFIGIIFGHVIATNRGIKIPKVIQLFGWPVASLVFFSLQLITVKWASGNPYTALESALYGGWSKTISILAFSWLFFCCVTGHARLFNYILSLKMWIPLSRISYMLFLISPVVQVYNLTNSGFPQEFANMPMIWRFFGSLFVSIILSAVFFLAIEWPILSMEKILFPGNRKNLKSPAKPAKELTSSNTTENGVQENGKFTTVHL